MLTILLVESDPSIRLDVEIALRAEGYAVCMPVVAPFAAGALKLLETEPVGAVLLGLLRSPYSFESFEGFYLARCMRDEPAWRDIPIFLTCGLDASEIHRRAMEYTFQGMKTYQLGQPINTELLFNRLAEIAAALR